MVALYLVFFLVPPPSLLYFLFIQPHSFLHGPVPEEV
jgi:hypothetical protein